MTGPAFPLRVGADGRHFVDSAGEPFFLLGDTQWELVRGYSLAQAELILRTRAAQGFTAVLVMLLSVGASGTADGPADGSHPNTDGHRPWIDGDPLRPDEGYFRNVDAVVSLAAALGLGVVLGIYHARSGAANPIQLPNARAWARWLGERYRGAANIVWSMYPRAGEASLAVARELAAGLREGDGGGHLVSVHPDPAPASSGPVFHGEEWLSFDTIQTFSAVEGIPPMIEADRGRVPTKPVVMAEGAYEAGIEYGFPVTPLWVRRQAYYSVLSGASHCYGHNDLWRMWPTWKEALQAPGARQLSVLRGIIAGLPEWWRLEPDRGMLGGPTGGTDSRIINLAARHPDGAWGLVYLGAGGQATIRMGRASSRGQFAARWIDPRDGTETQAGAVSAPAPAATLTAPDGWEDAVLVLETGGPQGTFRPQS